MCASTIEVAIVQECDVGNKPLLSDNSKYLSVNHQTPIIDTIFI